MVQQLPLPTSVTTLANGLKVILHEDRRAPIVAVRLVLLPMLNQATLDNVREVVKNACRDL